MNKPCVCVDKGQKDGKHEVKHRYIAESCDLLFIPLPYGDYISATEKVKEVINRRGDLLKKMDLCGIPSVAIDTKANMEEIYSNIIGKSHARFRDECILAQNNGCKLIVLVENEHEISSLEEVRTWENPRIKKYFHFKKLQEQGKARNVKLAKKPPCSSLQLEESMRTMQEKYGVQFVFCDEDEAGKMVIDLLEMYSESQ